MRKIHLYVSNFITFEETYLVRVEELPNVASFSVNILSVLKALFSQLFLVQKSASPENINES